MRNDKRMCLCTGMLYDPAEHPKRQTTRKTQPEKEEIIYEK